MFVVLAILRDHHPELSFRVIVGPGNEQAVVWLTDAAHRPRPVSEESLASYRGLRYADVFATGIPEWFRGGDEDTIVREAVAAVTERAS